MDQTANYQLPQWGAADPVRTGDLNGAMAGIDGALAEVRAGAEQADAALSKRVDEVKAAAGNAQTTADTARSEAAAAQTAAESATVKAETRRFVVGSYVGKGAETSFSLGFRPFMMIICGDIPGSNSQTMGQYSGVPVANGLWDGLVQFNDKGFTLKSAPNTYPKLNEQYHLYSYTAFM